MIIIILLFQNVEFLLPKQVSVLAMFHFIPFIVFNAKLFSLTNDTLFEIPIKIKFYF